MTENDTYLPYAAVLIKLLKGNLFDSDVQTWNNLIQYKQAIQNYFSSIGLELFVHENDGYAFLRQKDFEEQTDQSLPSLVSKKQLTFHVTTLCVLLVERLYEDQNTKGNDSPYLTIDRKSIYNLMEPFMADTSNEARTKKKIDSFIDKVKDYGFLRPLKSDENTFEVRRILCAKIPNEKLHEIKEKLVEYSTKEEEIEDGTELID
ncbi:protein of unknown function [Methanolobus vulcani]|uniref:DUF4194 domain-containing protein n=1 Tax=Methanolobus vulcani TaxID=38026 RepID=A0A7Z7AZE6_9EURY|nr:DUF4194 domain-containing protein [Methanolobus vulcani]SDF93540.1 protein of unknown function [Methanolobus vulcani]